MISALWAPLLKDKGKEQFRDGKDPLKFASKGGVGFVGPES